jgi:hypothetical protein
MLASSTAGRLPRPAAREFGAPLRGKVASLPGGLSGWNGRQAQVNMVGLLPPTSRITIDITRPAPPASCTAESMSWVTRPVIAAHIVEALDNRHYQSRRRRRRFGTVISRQA